MDFVNSSHKSDEKSHCKDEKKKKIAAGQQLGRMFQEHQLLLTLFPRFEREVHRTTYDNHLAICSPGRICSEIHGLG